MRRQTTRRQFLKAAGTAVTAGVIAACNNETIRLKNLPPSKWVKPEVWRSIVPTASLDDTPGLPLRVSYASHRIGTDDVYLRSYNSALRGPEIRVRPGETLVIDLTNELPTDEPEPPHEGMNQAHGLNVTNLHTHGLHVSPKEGDNVFLEIGRGAKDGTSKRLVYQIPADHPPGTFWYHPHKHGAAAIQIGNGMAGALIVEGDIDEVPEIAAAQDVVLLFQQIPYNGEGRVNWAEVNQPFPTTETRRSMEC